MLPDTKSTGKLVWTRGSLVATVDAFQTGYYVFDFHTTHQRRDALEVAIAAAKETNLLYYAVFNLEFNKLATGALSFVLVGHYRYIFNPNPRMPIRYAQVGIIIMKVDYLLEMLRLKTKTLRAGR